MVGLQALDAEKKLGGAFEIAASLRKLLEDKDLQLNHLLATQASKDIKVTCAAFGCSVVLLPYV